MRIAYLPLDSRPCNHCFPVQLARWSGHECVVPEEQEMDCFARPARFEDSMRFLERSIAKADALVIAVDHLCYGSLLASRQDEVPLEEAQRRLSALADLHARYSDVPIYAYSIMMRSSISTLAAGDWDAYQAMTEYSVYSDRARCLGMQEDRVRAERARMRIPAAVLSQYERVRKRNHAINRMCLQMAAEGVFASLALLQEDSQPYGFHKMEQRILLGECERYRAGNVWMRNGADECGCMTVMKALSQGRRLEADVVWLGEQDWVALYEDRPFRDNVGNALEDAGLHIVRGAKSVLAICCPPQGVQSDYMDEENGAGIGEQAAALAQMIAEGRQVYLLDVRQANGGSYGLLRALVDRCGSIDIAGYSAWNTASNALGTAIAQLMSDQLAGSVNTRFLAERILDDLVYQRIVRTRLDQNLRKRNEDPFNLKDPERAQHEMRALFSQVIREDDMLSRLSPCSVRLPWSRTFEVCVQIEQENAIDEQHTI